MKVQITKITENGYEWLVNTNDVIDNVETLISFLTKEGKDFEVKNNVELFAAPSDCSEMDEVANKEWN